ncbi:hypothetical protein V5799_025504 [Amblyomma americanum]|uniref:RRM domain-containing protein n=1 Tax=Amblyomma americanum TaxID=6943 RepID=A0AAQ4E9C4_AMBAM
MAAPLVYVTVFRLPPTVTDDALAAALGAYGKVSAVTEPVFKSRDYIRNGCRILKLEMQRVPPNFLTVLSHRAMLEYRGMKWVCSRCKHN